jgi:hypothetical protein
MDIEYSNPNTVIYLIDVVITVRPTVLVVVAVYLIWLGVPAILEWILDDEDL